jgi:geranylgeranyl pyrophosphate synthase
MTAVTVNRKLLLLMYREHPIVYVGRRYLFATGGKRSRKADVYRMHLVNSDNLI